MANDNICCGRPAWSAFDGQEGSWEVALLQPCGGGEWEQKGFVERNRKVIHQKQDHLEGKIC